MRRVRLGFGLKGVGIKAMHIERERNRGVLPVVSANLRYFIPFLPFFVLKSKFLGMESPSTRCLLSMAESSQSRGDVCYVGILSGFDLDCILFPG